MSVHFENRSDGRDMMLVQTYEQIHFRNNKKKDNNTYCRQSSLVSGILFMKKKKQLHIYTTH